MSHVVKLKLQVRDLSALELAAAELGCELVRDQKTHLYYAGNRAKCDHVIRVKGAGAQTYEIGVIAKIMEIEIEDFASVSGSWRDVTEDMYRQAQENGPSDGERNYRAIMTHYDNRRHQ